MRFAPSPPGGIAGTGAHVLLHGTGTVSGIADHNIDLITRIYQCSVHFD